jgi:PAS domain S-box-containing protein
MRKESQNLHRAKALNEQRGESEERSRDLLNNLPVAVVEYSADTSLLFCNRQALKLLGLKKAEVTGRVAVHPTSEFQSEDGT